MKLSTAVLGAIAVVKADDHDITLYGSCVKDEKSNRVLPHRLMESEHVPVRVRSVEECTAGCRAKQRHDNKNHFGYPYAGVEYLTECWCGDEPEEGFPFTWSYQCNMRCSGDYAGWENCGGYGAMNVWSVLPQVIDGVCVGDAPGDQRVLHGGSLQRIKVENLTPDICKNICLDEDFRYYGVEYGDSCYCGNEADRALRVSQPEVCSAPCIGDDSLMCGGDFRMNIYGPTFYDITPNKVVFENRVVHNWWDFSIDLNLNNKTIDDKANIFGMGVKDVEYGEDGAPILAIFLNSNTMELEICLNSEGFEDTLCETLSDPVTQNEWFSLYVEQWCWFFWGEEWCTTHVYRHGGETWIEQWFWWNPNPLFVNVEGVIGDTYGDEEFAVASGYYKNVELNQYETADLAVSSLVDSSALIDQSAAANAP